MLRSVTNLGLTSAAQAFGIFKVVDVLFISQREKGCLILSFANGVS